MAGYHLAIHASQRTRLAAALNKIEREDRGFAFEGAGMALALLDLLTPWRRDRLLRFLAGPGEPHTYMVIIGAGWAYARLRLRPDGLLRRLDPVLGWLAIDGYGFHEGFFHPRRTVAEGRRPRRLKGYARRAFDTGLGRSLWFSGCGDPETIAARIEALPEDRHPELWSGAGLACTYAGGVDDATIRRFLLRAGEHRGAVAQGAAFAAKARLRAGNPAEHTRRAVEIFCETSPEIAAGVCDEQLRAIPAGSPARGLAPAFELWRQGIRQALEQGLAGASLVPQGAPAGGEA